MDAFDSDVLIYAATGHRLASRIRELVIGGEPGVGSVVLIPEVLPKPLRRGSAPEAEELTSLLDFLTLVPCDLPTARLAGSLGALYALKAVDAVHLATAVQAGADRFVTNNRRDFPKTIEEIQIVYPDDT